MDVAPIANSRVQIASLTNTAQTVFAASGVAGDYGHKVVLGWILMNGAAQHDVIFRAVDDSPEYFRVRVAANQTLASELPFAVNSAEGLEVITGDAAGDVYITFFYYQPGSRGLGA